MKLAGSRTISAKGYYALVNKFKGVWVQSYSLSHLEVIQPTWVAQNYLQKASVQNIMGIFQSLFSPFRYWLKRTWCIPCHRPNGTRSCDLTYNIAIMAPAETNKADRAGRTIDWPPVYGWTLLEGIMAPVPDGMPAAMVEVAFIIDGLALIGSMTGA